MVFSVVAFLQFGDRVNPGTLSAQASLSYDITPAGAGEKIVFYVQGSNVFETGHAFVQFLPDTGAQAGDQSLEYGFYPNSWNMFGGNGIVYPNDNHPWDWRIVFHVTDEQYTRRGGFRK